jgi:transcriptional regulator with XRE-family HTH domain
MDPTRLKELRRAKGLKQSDMAETFHISRIGYSHWESGTFEPNVETLIKLADFFGVTVDYLIGHESAATNEAKLEAAQALLASVLQSKTNKKS